MARNPDNAKLWTDAWVSVATGPTRPTLPATIDAVLPVDYVDTGLLDGEAGIGEERSSDRTEHFGWGAGIVKVGNRNFKVAGTFTPLEDNVEIRSILWGPGSSATALYMPKPVYRWLAFETLDDAAKKERLFTTRPAELWIPNNNRNESDISKWEVQYTLFADGTGKIFDRQVAA